MTKTNTVEKREPFVRIVKRTSNSSLHKIAVYAIATVVAFALIFLLSLGVTGESIGNIGTYMWEGAFGTSFAVNETLKNVMILLGISLALAPAFKLKFWNIGAQGQVLLGALFSAIVVKYLGGVVEDWLLVILMIIVSLIGGALWALIPALFKVKTGANETLFTLMMNYIGIQLVLCFVDWWKGKNTSLGTFSYGFLPKVFGNEYGFTFLVIGILTVLLFFYMSKTKHGYEISVVGESLNTARYAGMNTSKIILRTLAISGAICGFVGFLYVGNVHTLSTAADGGYGFTAIIVSWGAHFNPFAMALVSFAIIFLERGASGIVDKCNNLNAHLSYIYVGIFLFCLIACDFFLNYKLVFATPKKKEKAIKETKAEGGEAQ